MELVLKTGYRTSFNTFISNDKELNSIKELNLITQTLTDTELETHESLCIVRYTEGQEYKAIKLDRRSFRKAI